MADAIKSMTGLLRKTFEKNAWHGPSVREVLDGIPENAAFAKLQDTHSIIELVAHMHSWREFVIHKLQGDLHYSVNDGQNFPAVSNWNEVKEKLYQSQERLMSALESFPESSLMELVPHASHKYTYYTMVHGIIHHDLYHLGQIVLIKKATEKL
ncbi:MAG TPA: DinB family protein [Chryseosolibacter sp.]|nr:DinB family protein [Chryseosolibacter sp.]